MTWVWVVLVLGVIFAIGWGWETLKEKGGKAGEAAEATERGLEWIKVKGAGLFFAALGVVGLVALFMGPFEWWKLGGALLFLPYGLYLLAPGGDKWTFF